MTKARTRNAAASVPLPGRPVKGSETGRPIMALIDLIGRRWQLRVLWELRNGPLKFRPLQAACGDLSPTILNRRLAELRAAQLVEAGEAGYALSPLGREFERAFAPLYRWSSAWSEALENAPDAAPTRSEAAQAEAPARPRRRAHSRRG